MTEKESTATRLSQLISKSFVWKAAAIIAAEIDSKDATIDALRAELAEARAFISAVIDAPKDYPAEEGM